MTSMSQAEWRSTEQEGAGSHLREIVLGLHWDPQNGSDIKQSADLDALCVLRDSEDRALEVIHPGNLCGAQGSVIHTGDSRTGTSSWDDERIFVFLDPLPAVISSVILVVASAAGHSFDEVPGALCHVSDRLSETEWLRQDLTALVGKSIHVVATLRRTGVGWIITKDSHADPQLLAMVRLLLKERKGDATPLMASPR